MKKDYDFKENQYTARIRIKPEDLEWLKQNKKKKSAAGFLEEILKFIKATKQFKKHL